MWQKENDQIGTLKVRGSREDTPALRLALANLLNAANLHAPGMPPSAILIIRHLADPVPEKLAPHRGITGINIEWEKAMQAVLSEVYDNAVRPVMGRVNPNAEAVIFVDKAEMLACLALDISRDEAGGHWWWRVILRGLQSLSKDGIMDILRQNALYLPAVIHYLTNWAEIIHALNPLSPGQASTLLSGMCRSYGLTDPGLNTVMTKDKNKTLDASDSFGILPPDGTGGNPFSGAPAPWDKWFPTGSYQRMLTKEKVCLMGLGLSLHYYPFIARGTPFQKAMCAWWGNIRIYPYHAKYPYKNAGQNISEEYIRRPGGALRESPGSPGPGFDQKGDGLLAKEKDVSKDGSLDARIDPISKTMMPDSTKSSKSSYIKGKHTAERPDSFSSHRFAPHLQTGNGPIKWEQGKKDQKTPGKLPITKARTKGEMEKQPVSDALFGKGALRDLPNQPGLPGLEKRPPLLHFDEPAFSYLLSKEGIATQLAGLFYLINLMQYLNLPACFEKDWGLATRIGPWGTLEILGRAMLGPGHEYLSDDPVWQILARLDGREPGDLPGRDFRLDTAALSGLKLKREPGELPGRDFRCSPCFSLPEEWLAQTGTAKESTWFWAHNEGSESPPIARLSSPLLRGLNQDLLRWLSMVMPFIIFWLGRAIAIDPKKENAGTCGKMAEILLLYNGRVFVTSSHVDLVMSMDDISLPVRMAGLDRNPGWLPDFGRVVLFHFD